MLSQKDGYFPIRVTEGELPLPQYLSLLLCFPSFPLFRFSFFCFTFLFFFIFFSSFLCPQLLQEWWVFGDGLECSGIENLYGGWVFGAEST